MSSDENTQPPSDPELVLATEPLVARRPTWKTTLLVVLAVLFCLAAMRFYYHRWRQYQVQLIVQQQLEPLGVTPGYWRGELMQLSFGSRPIEPRHLAWLSRFPQLRRLVLLETPIPEGSLGMLRDVPELVELVLIDVRLSPGDVAAIGELESLKYLQMTRAGLTDEHLAPLSNLKQLERLDLNQNSFGDAGLLHLSGLERLEQLFVAGTDVTDDGQAALQRHIPRLVIRR
jgi:hypothetical protein